MALRAMVGASIGVWIIVTYFSLLTEIEPMLLSMPLIGYILVVLYIIDCNQYAIPNLRDDQLHSRDRRHLIALVLVYIVLGALAIIGVLYESLSFLIWNAFGIISTTLSYYVGYHIDRAPEPEEEWW